MLSLTQLPGICGCCNQLFSLVNAIAIAHQQNRPAIVLPQFLSEINTSRYCKWSEVIDLAAYNRFLISNFNLCLIDSADLKVDLLDATYGEGLTQINVKQEMRKNAISRKNNREFRFKQQLVFNNLAGDPILGRPKQLTLIWKIGDSQVAAKHNEGTADVSLFEISTPNPFRILSAQDTVQCQCLANLPIHPRLSRNSPTMLNGKVNAAHLRLEGDAIQHWSQMNKMSTAEFTRILHQKYIELLNKNIDKESPLLLFTYSVANKVVDWLKAQGYNIYVLTKLPQEGREVNALCDLHFAKQCNGTFISAGGSTFSFTIEKLVCPGTKIVTFDLNAIV